MLEYEVAAIYYFVAGIVKAEHYFEELPEDIIFPCVFYPVPSVDSGRFSLSKYADRFVIYIKFMARSTMSAYQMAAQVECSLMERCCKIPLVDMEGKELDKHVWLNPPVLRRVDIGVYQMELSWKRYGNYAVRQQVKAQEVLVNIVHKKGEL